VQSSSKTAGDELPCTQSKKPEESPAGVKRFQLPEPFIEGVAVDVVPLRIRERKTQIVHGGTGHMK